MCKSDLTTWMRDCPFCTLLPCLTYASITLHHVTELSLPQAGCAPGGGRRVSRKLGMSTRYIQGAVYLELPGPELSVTELHVYLPRISGEEDITGSSYLSSPTLFFFFFLLILVRKEFYPYPSLVS